MCVAGVGRGDTLVEATEPNVIEGGAFVSGRSVHDCPLFSGVPSALSLWYLRGKADVRVASFECVPHLPSLWELLGGTGQSWVEETGNE